MPRFIVLVMLNRRTRDERQYFAEWVPLDEREARGRQLVATDPDELDPADWDYFDAHPAGPPR